MGRALLGIVAFLVASQAIAAELWRYDPGTGLWTRERATQIGNRTGLFWQDGKMVVSGPVKCNDVMLPPPPRPGMVAACIPSERSARAGYVPDPRTHAR
jgi:hypothetical protein